MLAQLQAERRGADHRRGCRDHRLDDAERRGLFVLALFLIGGRTRSRGGLSLRIGFGLGPSLIGNLIGRLVGRFVGGLLAQISRGDRLLVLVDGDLLAADQFERGGFDQLLQIVGIGFQHQHVAGEKGPMTGRDVAPVALADDRGDGDVLIGQRFKLVHRLAGER